MGSIELSRAETRKGDLPLVCIVCGHVGDVYREKILSCNPWWVYLGLPFGLFPYLLLALVCSPRRRVRAPFCDLHQYHWLWRTAVSYAWLGLSLVFLCFTLPALLERTVWRGRSLVEDDGVGIMIFVLFLGNAAGLIFWPFLDLLLRYSGVHASAITPDRITLTPIPEEFIEAVRVYRQDQQSLWSAQADDPHPSRKD